MKVALDATPLSVATGGITRYTRELAAALRDRFPEDHFELLEQRAGWWNRRWWSCGLPLELVRRGFDVFHGTDFAVPYVPVRPAVMTVHDLSPWAGERWRAPSARVRRRTPYLVGLRLATMVITPSESVRREAMERFRIPPGRIVAVPLAAPPHFRPAPPRQAAPYFLFVGTLEPRKNLPLLVEAWRQVRQRHEVDLVLAGRRREDAPAITDQPGLHMPGAVAEADLPALYSGAVALAYPSLYEGFGLPALEAMQCGAPVIASRDPALMEVSGGAALHVEATDVRGWAEAMTAIVENATLREELREAGLRRAAGYTWQNAARGTREVYEEARRRFDR